MKNLCIIENISDPSAWEKVEVESVSAYLFERYGVMPTGGRLYRGNVSELTDITPTCEKEIEDLEALQDDIYFVIYPEDFATTMLVIQIVIAVVSIAIAFIVKPKIPNVSSRLNNSQMASPNNALSSRTNEARPNARIPDIYGQVRAYPDLLQLPLRYFIDNEEYEYSLMCVGRERFSISEVKDGDTEMESIIGSRCAFFTPGDTPGVSTPFYSIGASISSNEAPIKTIYRSNSVDGITLYSPGNTEQFSNISVSINSAGTGRIRQTTFNKSFRRYFSLDGKLTTNTLDVIDDYGNTVNLDVVDRTITGVSDTQISISQPAVSNLAWTSLTVDTEYGDIPPVDLIFSGNKETGPFTISQNDCESVLLNFVAPNGLYKDDGSTFTPFPISIDVKIQKIDANDNPVGSPQIQSFTVPGSSENDLTVGYTVKMNLTTPGRSQVSVTRTTPKDTIFTGTVSDELKWRDLYIICPANANFSGITTCQVITRGTQQALTLKDRKLNCLVTRKLLIGGVYTATKSAFEALKSVISDSRIGNMTAPSSFGVTESEIQTYFGTTKATEFSYTFDNSNVSFEEMVSAIASAIHCTAYRQGSTIKLKFEKDEENAVLLFNHRNKIPDSETRIVNFGWNGENDGVEYTFVDPSDDSIDTIYFPENRSSIKPKKIESIGVRSRLQAYFIARRIYNKIRYQNLTCEFDALQESNILVMGDKLLVSDSTRAGVQDGQIEAQNGLELTLSQSVTLDPLVGNTIYLQHMDGTTEALACTAGSDSHKILLSQAPKAPLSLDWDHYAKATYLLVSNDDVRIRDFLLVEKNPKGNFTNSLKCINYDARYYQNDTDFINDLIDENGNPTT